MIEIRPGDEGRELWDILTQDWVKITEVTACRPFPVMFERKNSDIDYCNTNGGMLSSDRTPRYVWEETPPIEFRKRPKEKKKIDLWVGIGGCIIGHAYEVTGAYLNKKDVECINHKYGIHKITIETEEEES